MLEMLHPSLCRPPNLLLFEEDNYGSRPCEHTSVVHHSRFRSAARGWLSKAESHHGKNGQRAKLECFE